MSGHWAVPVVPKYCGKNMADGPIDLFSSFVERVADKAAEKAAERLVKEALERAFEVRIAADRQSLKFLAVGVFIGATGMAAADAFPGFLGAGIGALAGLGLWTAIQELYAMYYHMTSEL